MAKANCGGRTRAADWLIGLIVGVDMLVSGAALIAIALDVRTADA